MGNNFKNQEQRDHWNRYNSAYSKEHYKTYTVKFNRQQDKDVIDFLNQNSKSITATLKTIIREYLKTRRD